MFHLSEHNTTRSGCVGILLTGGASRRFGNDKLTQRVDDSFIAELAARSLSTACENSYEAGNSLTDLPQIPGTLGQGPLAAIAHAVSFLRQRELLDLGQCAIVLAGDVPFVQPSTLAILNHWPGSSSVVPVIDGEGQYLAARWSAESLDKSAALVSTGVRKVREALVLPRTQWLTIEMWEKENYFEFLDVDTPEDFSRAIETRRASLDGRATG